MKSSVYLALPCHGYPHPASTNSALLHATANKVHLHIVSRDCSLLAHGFNLGWVEFLKGNFTHFCMLHSDVAPSRFWLDTLIEESKRFPVLHAPVAMKDDRGLTSTALGHMDMPFGLCRRLAVKELHRLPPTFGYREAIAELKCGQEGWALLPNTGCFVVERARFPVHLFRGFEIRSTIVKNPAGEHEAVTEPEDWNFGRFCAQHGVEVGATTKVITRHFGVAEYTTEAKDGGWESDKNYEQSLTGLIS